MDCIRQRLSINCHNCPGCGHQFTHVKGEKVKGNCGDEVEKGDCFGVIEFSIKNPSQQFIELVNLGEAA